ncbi:sodium:solute symporter family transporter [Shigella flexneri]
MVAGKLIELLFGLNYSHCGGAGRRAHDDVRLRRHAGDHLGTGCSKPCCCLVQALAFMVMNASALASTNLLVNDGGTPKGVDIMKPGGLVKDPISALSSGMGLMFEYRRACTRSDALFQSGDAREARKSVFYATGFIAALSDLCIGLQRNHAGWCGMQYKDAAGHLVVVIDMAAVHLANAVGGNLFLGFIQRLLSPLSSRWLRV